MEHLDCVLSLMLVYRLAVRDAITMSFKPTNKDVYLRVVYP